MQHRLIPALLSAALLLPVSAMSADPADGALTETSLTLSYTTGPMPVPNVNSAVLEDAPYVCDTTHPCDDFVLTVDLPEDYLDKYPKAAIKVAATTDTSDIDLQVTDSEGAIIAFVRDNPPAQPALSFKPKNGLNVYHVQIVPGLPVPDASGAIELVPGPAASGKSAIERLGGAFNFALLLPLLALGALRRRT